MACARGSAGRGLSLAPKSKQSKCTRRRSSPRCESIACASLWTARRRCPAERRPRGRGRRLSLHPQSAAETHSIESGKQAPIPAHPASSSLLMGCASGKDNNAETPPAHAEPRAGDEPASSSQPPCGLAPLPANAPVRAVVVLCVSNGRALILRRGKTAPWAPGMWSLPGGKVDRGETVLAAGERELGEETDLVPVGARALGAPYVHAPGGGYGMAAVLCGCESEAPIG